MSDAEAVCTHCGAPRSLEGVAGSYCSQKCYYEAKGEKALNKIRSDHRWCGTCFKRVKTLERPREFDPNHVIGYQHPTENTEVGVIDDHQPDGGDPRERANDTKRPQEFTRWGCVCGTVNPQDDHPFLRESGLPRKQTVKDLLLCLQALIDEGVIEADLSAKRFVRAFGQDRGNWAYAIGFALYGDDV